MKPAIAMKPIGMFTQKIQAQETLSTMMPPASGPTTAEVAQTLEISPCTRPRSSSL